MKATIALPVRVDQDLADELDNAARVMSAAALRTLPMSRVLRRLLALGVAVYLASDEARDAGSI